MSRRQRTQSAAAVSMFPFLAVLLCTMGALILLLVLLAQQAKVQAASNQEAQLREAEKEEEQFEKRRRKLQETQAHIRRQLEEIGSTLAEERLALSHVEDHARTLRKRLQDLERQLTALESDPSQQTASGDIMIRLNQVREETAQLQQALQQAEEQAAQQQVSYAIVPYEGANQTLRRPIYIECRSDAIILQPEGIRLTVDDFRGPLDPSNPLASALRSANEFYAENALSGQGPVGEPYPFFLVRPDGVVAYSVARAALSSWGSEFGYELVDQDWNLKYPPKDPELAVTERLAVQRARERQVQLSRIAPSYYGRNRPDSFDDFDDDATPGGSGKGRSGSGGGGGRGDRYGGGNGASPGGTELSGTEFGSEGGSELGSYEATGNSDQSNTGDAGGSALQGSGGGSQTADTGGDGDPRGNSNPSSSGDFASQSNVAGGSSSDIQGNTEGGSPSMRAQKSLAESRGRDWAIGGSSRGSIGIRRPIRIYCRADHLVVMPDDRGQRQGKIIPLGNQTAASVDDLVSAVHKHMDAWGTAGDGMHWRPELRLQPEAGAEGRVNDLARILQNSGFDIKVDQASNVVRTPPLQRTR